MSAIGHDFSFCVAIFVSCLQLIYFNISLKKKEEQESFPYGSYGSDRFVLLLSILLVFELLKGGIYLQP